MKTKSFFVLLILFTMTLSFSASGQGNKFSGEWKLNKEKTVLAENQLFLSAITIQIKGDTLFTTRTYSNPNGEEYPFDENITLDGRECKIAIYDMPRTSKALKSQPDGALIIESTTTFTGQSGEENLVAKETWKVDAEGNTLTMDFNNKMSGNEFTGTNYYNKVK
jgi:hypothetical protein